MAVLTCWVVLYVMRYQDDRAALDARRRGFQVWNPKYREMKASSHNRVTTTVVPMFPGFLFVDCEGRFSDANGIRGTRGMLRFGDQIARLRDGEVESFYEFERADGTYDFPPAYAQFAVGDDVELSRDYGVLPSGGRGRVAGIDAQGRLQVLFSLLGRKVPQTIPSAVLRAA